MSTKAAETAVDAAVSALVSCAFEDFAESPIAMLNATIAASAVSLTFLTSAFVTFSTSTWNSSDAFL
ncbi:MAG TPA: hypothetical protein VGC41_05210, partial [Kofleriaceae bacterium]